MLLGSCSVAVEVDGEHSLSYSSPAFLLAHSMSLCNREASVVRLSVNFAQIATSTTNMTRSPPNLHTMVPRRACIQGVLKVMVKVKGHVIRALL